MENYIPCQFDFDCPGSQVCYSNVSHTDVDFGACFCNSYYGWVLNEEDDTCVGQSITFYLLFGLVAAECILIGGLSLISIIDAVRVFQIGLEKLRRALSIVVTSVTLPLALGSLLAWRLMFILSVISPEKAVVSLPQDAELVDREKFAYFEIRERPFVFAALLFTATSAGSLALMWISISERVQSLQMDSVSSWREIIFLFFFFCFTSIGVVAISIDWDITGPTSLPFLIILIGMLVVGRKRMVDLLQVAVDLEREQSRLIRPVGSVAQFGEIARKERRAMKAINRAGLHIIIGLTGILFAGTATFILNVMGGGWKEFAPIGGFSWITFTHELVPLFTIYILFAIFVYVHRNTNKLLSGKQSRATQSSFAALTHSTYGGDPAQRKASINPLTIAPSHFPNL